MEEIWRDIPDTCGRYQISNTGKYRRTQYTVHSINKFGTESSRSYPQKELELDNNGCAVYRDSTGHKRYRKIELLIKEVFGESRNISTISNTIYSSYAPQKGIAKKRDRRSPLDKYKKDKKKLLKEFGIHLTDAENLHIDSLETETQVDNYARKLIMR